MDAAVISIHVTLSNGTDGELPRAYVVLKDSETFNYDDGELKVNNDYGNLANLTENDVKLFMSARLSQYKDLTGGVRFIEQIPRSATGKTLKNVLRGMASEEVPEALAQDPKTT
ncbi:hypothetical protein MMC09_000204 [Bachmanniomyces sp. S44760]|nr:hypothetical protein [Bachmanniomyces sp. S44760]